MAKQGKQLVDRVFAFTSDADLDTQIKAFKAEYEAEHGDGLALDQKRSLGVGKVRLSFRVVPRPGKKR
jgi:hypothetical protein